MVQIGPDLVQLRFGIKCENGLAFIIVLIIVNKRDVREIGLIRLLLLRKKEQEAGTEIYYGHNTMADKSL